MSPFGGKATVVLVPCHASDMPAYANGQRFIYNGGPVAETPFGSLGVKVTVPSSLPVAQNSSLTVKKVRWKTSFAAVAASVVRYPPVIWGCCASA
jgi:hypothetical protein